MKRVNQRFGAAVNEAGVLCIVEKCSASQSLHSFKFNSGSY